MQENGLPNTFVPGRNLVFLTFAGALAYRRGIDHIVGGMCETDYSGYPDCRDDTIRALQVALNLGMNKTFELHTPLMWLDKASTWKLANELGGAGWSISFVSIPTHAILASEVSDTSGVTVAANARPARCERKAGGNMLLS